MRLVPAALRMQHAQPVSLHLACEAHGACHVLCQILFHLSGAFTWVSQVDTKAEAVLLPIYGVLVPFHITTIRNVTTTNDAGGDAALVRTD